MSFRHIADVWDRAIAVNRTELLVLLALASWAGEDGRCWPSLQAVSNRARCSERQARRILRKLEGLEVLRVKIQPGRKKTNTYWLDLSAYPMKKQDIVKPDISTTTMPNKPDISTIKPDTAMSPEYPHRTAKIKREYPNSSAHAVRGEHPAPDKVSKGLGESKFTRIHGMIFSAYSQENGTEPPWGAGEAGQLSQLLKETPRWEDQLYAQCLGNMYASTGFAKGTRPREWLGKLPKYLKGPLDEFNHHKGAGNGAGTSKGTDAGRANRNIQALVLSSVGDGVQRVHVPDGPTVQAGIVNRSTGRSAGSFSDGEVLAREPERSKPK